MPGSLDSHHLFRVQDERSNSKADTFFIRPKEIGSPDTQVQRTFVQELNGDVTGNQAVTDLTGTGLNVTSGGTLESTAAGSAVAVESDGTQVVSGTDTLDFGPKLATTNPAGDEADVGLDTPYSDLTVLHGSPVQVGASDLQLQTGQALEDGSGTARASVGTNTTTLNDDTGTAGLTLESGVAYQHEARATEPVQIRDQQGGFTGVQYDTDSTQGTLSLPNASLDAQNGIENSTASFVELPSDNLRLATGQSIEDGSGTTRVNLTTGTTDIHDTQGVIGLRILDGTTTLRVTSSSGSVNVFDDVGVFSAVEYKPSSSAPGTLSLDNAVLDAKSRSPRTSTAGTTFGSALNLAKNGSAQSLQLSFENGNGEIGALRNQSGEMEAIDTQGNSTIIT